MKKLIAFLKFFIPAIVLIPSLAFATNDSVSISPITPVCGQQSLQVTVNAQYGRNNRHLVTYLDGQQIDHYNNEPATVTETVNVGPGSHQFKARIYLIEWDATHFSIKLAEASRTFTVPTCEEPPVVIDVCLNLEGSQTDVPEGYTLNGGICEADEVEVPPTDVCSNIEGNQETVPEGMESTDGQCQTTPPNEQNEPINVVSTTPGVSGSGSGTTPSFRLCYLSGGQICIPWDQVTPEVNQAMMQLIDLIIQRNQTLYGQN